jgi:hypothetical protein
VAPLEWDRDTAIDREYLSKPTDPGQSPHTANDSGVSCERTNIADIDSSLTQPVECSPPRPIASTCCRVTNDLNRKPSLVR